MIKTDRLYTLYHLATDEQTGHVNQILENMHRAYVDTKQIYSIPALLGLGIIVKNMFLLGLVLPC